MKEGEWGKGFDSGRLVLIDTMLFQIRAIVARMAEDSTTKYQRLQLDMAHSHLDKAIDCIKESQNRPR